MLNIEQPGTHKYALHHLGFRPFFLLAGLFAVILMAMWVWFFHFKFGYRLFASEPAGPDTMDWYLDRVMYMSDWHAHEMIFGYVMACIAGFLLTAIRNWTNHQTLNGPSLLFLALLWVIARLMPILDQPWAIYVMAISDSLFNILLIPALLIPLVKTQQRQHYFIVAIVAIIGLCNILYYLDVIQYISIKHSKALFTGFYLELLLVMIMGRRVIPFFIENAVSEPKNIQNHPFVDKYTLILMGFFVVFAGVFDARALTEFTALLLVSLQVVRLYHWHHRDIWHKPLLWVLYMGYIWIVIGFALYALEVFNYRTGKFALHAFAYGGLGMITLGMMTRVSLGHTGRNVFEPPAILFWIFLFMLLGTIVRVILPIVDKELFQLWIAISQGCWIAAFGLFCAVYAPMLIKARVDGRFG